MTIGMVALGCVATLWALEDSIISVLLGSGAALLVRPLIPDIRGGQLLLGLGIVFFAVWILSEYALDVCWFSMGGRKLGFHWEGLGRYRGFWKSYPVSVAVSDRYRMFRCGTVRISFLYPTQTRFFVDIPNFSNRPRCNDDQSASLMKFPEVQQAVTVIFNAIGKATTASIAIDDRSVSVSGDFFGRVRQRRCLLADPLRRSLDGLLSLAQTLDRHARNNTPAPER